MPELPEVHTTVTGLQRYVVGLKITEAWSNYDSKYITSRGTIKDPDYFNKVKGKMIGAKIISAERRAKNILINLDNGLTILIHLKMTGHLLYGRYVYNPKNKKDPWEPISPTSLKDPFNRRIHFMLTFNSGKNLALSDTRKFAKVIILDSKTAHTSKHLEDVGPEPLEKSFDFEAFEDRIDLKKNSKIKQVLMDQTIIAGIGNIYADETLWRAGIHPMEKVTDVSKQKRKLLFKAIKETLTKGIDFGGDSMSDYRNILGERGKFQEHHRAYRRTGQKCLRKGCKGTIRRVVIGSRSAHYCDVHQK